MLTHLSLFSGIGGLDLAAEWAGFRTVGQCEAADFQTRVLAAHWPHVPRWRDVRELDGRSFYERTGLRTVDLVSGGFPCQPFSVAGDHRGTADDRHLWPEMLRVIKDLRPSWVLGENVAGLVRMALDEVLSDLEAADYTARAFMVPACAVDAPHRRDRLAICAHANGQRREAGGDNGQDNEGQEGLDHNRARPAGNPWTAEPGVQCVADGVPSRMDRLRAIGNAVVPQQFYPILKAMYDIETERRQSK